MGRTVILRFVIVDDRRLRFAGGGDLCARTGFDSLESKRDRSIRHPSRPKGLTANRQNPETEDS
jgi:hypothetical protein